MSEKLKYSEDVDKLTVAIEAMENDMENLKKEHESRMDNAKKQYINVAGKLQKITSKLMKSDDNRYKLDLYKELKKDSMVIWNKNRMCQLSLLSCMWHGDTKG